MKQRFTKWYVKKGYKFRYDFLSVSVVGDELFPLACDVPRTVFNCPFWVKPFLIFFSPSVYFAEAVGKTICNAFLEGINKALSKEADTNEAD